MLPLDEPNDRSSGVIGSMVAVEPDVMKSSETQRWTRKCWSILILAIGSVLTQSGFAQAPHLTVPVQGGMPGLPLMTGIQSVGTNEVEAGPGGFAVGAGRTV